MQNHGAQALPAQHVVHPLVAYRKERGLTQRELAAALDVARETVARWEGGRRIDEDYLQAVSEHTGIPPLTLRPDLAKWGKEPSGAFE